MQVFDFFHKLIYNFCMRFWNKNKSNESDKESKYAETPENSHDSKLNPTKLKVIFYIWNIFSIVLFSSYTLFIIYKLSEKSFLSKIIIYLLMVYCIVFVLLILISIGNRTRLKYRLKNFQSATKFLKYAIQILNFILAIATSISVFFSTGKVDVWAFFYGIISIILTLLCVIFEIAKVIIRKNIPLIKQNFLEMRDKPVPNRKKKNEN